MFEPIRLHAIHTADGQITLSWGAVNDLGGRMQKSYRLIFDERLDSGWVEGTEQKVTLSLPYELGEEVCWSVALKDDLGNISKEAKGTFLYCHTKEFSGKWITDSEERESIPTVFQKTIDAAEEGEKALLALSAAGIFEAKLNGEKLGHAVLTPNVTNFSKRCFYRVYPLTLKKGANILEITLADGWRRNHCAIFDDQNVLAQATLMGIPAICGFVKIEERIIPTDESWICGNGKVTFAHLFDGESFDDRRETVCDRKTVLVENLPTPIYDYLEPITEQECYRPRAIISRGNGRFILDFGQNLQGYLHLHIPASFPAGTEITLMHSEELDEEDNLYTAVLRSAKATDRIITAGKALDWKPSFTYHGFRYAQIEGWVGELTADHVKACLISTSIGKNSSFECGSALLNAIQKNIVMTERSNLIGIATDCPQRDERMGWMNDATVRFYETPYNFDVSALFPKIVDDLRDEQGEDGAITCTAPLIFGNRPADPVCSSFLVAGWQNYLHTGDKATLKRAYPSFKAWNDCLEAHSDNHIVNYSYYGDWASPQYACTDNENSAHSGVTDGLLMSTGYHYFNACLLAKMAEALDMPEEALARKADAEAIQKAFLDRWFTAEPLKLSNMSEAEIAFSLWLGILPEEARVPLAKIMRDDLVARNYRFTTGNLCTVYMLEMLSAYGYVDDAYAMMTQEEYPSYGYMIQNAATTVWERFELKKDSGMNSHNHPMYGSVGSWLYSNLAGLKPVDPAWSKLTFKPFIPTDLLYVSANVETPKGDIYMKWQKKYGKTYVSLSIPFGCTAEISLPGINAEVSQGFHVYVLEEGAVK